MGTDKFLFAVTRGGQLASQKEPDQLKQQNSPSKSFFLVNTASIALMVGHPPTQPTHQPTFLRRLMMVKKKSFAPFSPVLNGDGERPMIGCIHGDRPIASSIDCAGVPSQFAPSVSLLVSRETWPN
jgi:hypothetical protein